MSNSGTCWQVQINGWTADLEHMLRHFEGLPVRVTKDGKNGFLYQSEAFDACSSSDEVLAIANEEMRILSGVMRFVRSSDEPLRTGVVYRCHADGTRDVFVHVQDTLLVRASEGDAHVIVTDAQGNVVKAAVPPPRTVAIAALALRDGAVAKAMRLLAAADVHSWVGLYRLYEVVEGDIGGESALKDQGWGSATDLKRFKHSANSVSVGGDIARHGKELTVPPPNPMSLEEASAYVTYLVSAWLSAKGV